MKITEVRIYPAREGQVKAYVSVVLDNCFIVKEMRLVETKDGELFVSMPSRRKEDGTYKDIAHPLDGETRKEFEKTVVDEYKRIYYKQQ